MATRRRTNFGLAELVFNFIGFGFLTLLMFQFLPGGSGVKAAAALESLGKTALTGITLLCIIVIAVKLISRSRRPRTPIERGNSTIFHSHVAKHGARNITPLHNPFAKPPPTITTDISSQLHNIDWFQFEKLVALTYRKLGYNVEHGGGAHPDGGIDLIIKKVGQRTAVQCKHWKNSNVGVKSIREFLAALKNSGIEKGIFVALNGYTKEARRLAHKNGIEIISESKLNLMLESTDARLDPEARQLLSDNHRFRMAA